MASLKIGAVPHSDERYITKLKFFKIQGSFLFSESSDIAFFKYETQEASRRLSEAVF